MPLRILVGVLFLAGCYEPSIRNGGFTCKPSDSPACPEGYFCVNGTCQDTEGYSYPGGGPGDDMDDGTGGDDMAMSGGDDDMAMGGDGDDMARPQPKDMAKAPVDMAKAPVDMAKAPVDMASAPIDMATGGQCLIGGSPCASAAQCCSGVCLDEGPNWGVICVGG